MKFLLLSLWCIIAFYIHPGDSVAQDVPFGISLPPSLNFATSPNPVGSGARAAGQSFAFIAVADDATAASHNPAGLTILQEPEVSIVGSYFIRQERQDVTQPQTVVEDQTLSSFNLNYLSFVYPRELLRRNVVVSVNFQRLFDLDGDTDVASRFTTIDGIQQVSSRQDGQLYTISPAVAVDITPMFSMGIAFNIWPDFSGNGWDQTVNVQGVGNVVSGNNIVPFTSSGRIKDDYDFQGFNVTSGFLWEISPIFKLGGVFRSSTTAKVTHKHFSSLVIQLQDDSDPVSAGDSFTETLDMDMPMSYGLGFSFRLSDSLTLAFDIERINWSNFKLEASTQDTLLVENGAPAGKGKAVLSGEADDTTSVRLGTEYLLIKPKFKIPLRTGVFYDPEPGDGGTDDFFGFSLGTGFQVKRFKQFNGDIAYNFRTGKVKSEATDTTVYQHKILASIIYHF